MENLSCQMNCHNCTKQESIEKKNICAILLMPSMFSFLINEIQELKELINKDIPVAEVTEIKVNDKSKKTNRNESNKSNNIVAVGGDEGEGGNG